MNVTFEQANSITAHVSSIALELSLPPSSCILGLGNNHSINLLFIIAYFLIYFVGIGV